MNLSWANSIAKAALKTAQQKIDTVLDIRTDEDSEEATSSVVLDDPLLTPVPTDTIEEGPLSNLFAVPDTGQEENWGSAWGGLPTDSQLIVDSEPNPIRDDNTNVTHLLDHSPSSENSSDVVDSHGSPVKISSEYADIDLHDVEAKEHDDTITHEPLLPPHHETNSLAGHHDDSLTVASSDIEVIRNVDAWSLSSSRITNDLTPTSTTIPKTESAAAFEAQLQMAEQRRNELKMSNDALQKTNVQLQQRIVILNQQHNALKKELEDKKKECEDVLQEGKKISDYSGKQSREIRRLKNELSDLEKIKAERKKYKDEKTQAEETIELQKEELTNLKNMVKTLETSVEQMKKENTQTVASSEAVQKHIEAQDKMISEMEAEIKKVEAEKAMLLENNKELHQEMDQMQASQWADRIAGERANEAALTVGQDLAEAREQIVRLTSQLNSTRMQLETALDQHSSIAETIAKANTPLLEELSELKAELASEQRLAEESDKKARQAKKECEELRKQLATLEEKHTHNVMMLRTEIESLLKNNTALETQIIRLRQGHQQETETAKKARATLQEKLEELQDKLLAAEEEAINLRKSLKEFKDDNDRMRNEVAELRKRGSTPTPPTNSTPLRQVPSNPPDLLPDVNVAGAPVTNYPPMAYSFAASGQAAQVELESMSAQYEFSLKRIAQLEGETKRVQQLEAQIKTLQRELKELNHQYNQLLELDGERLEKLEEQAHDIIDLRHLLREQLIAFADAKTKEEEERRKTEES